VATVTSAPLRQMGALSNLRSRPHPELFATTFAVSLRYAFMQKFYD